MNMVKVGRVYIQARPSAIPAYVILIALCAGVARRRYPRIGWGAAVMVGIGWAAMFWASESLHAVGHFLSSRAVNAPLNAIRYEWIFQRTVYYNNGVRPAQHFGRAVGGPLISAFSSLIGMAVWRAVRHVPILSSIAEAWVFWNTTITLVAMAPVESLDGGAMLRALRTMRELKNGQESVLGRTIVNEPSTVMRKHKT